MAETILIVDDAADLLTVLRDFFEAEGFAVQTAADGEAALQLFARQPADCVLLDVMLPGLTGYEVCRRLRECSPVPVLFLSANADDANKLRGLGLGDDYITKGSSVPEIVARVKAVLRRARPRDAVRQLNFGGLLIDLAAHEVRVAGEPVPMTAKEFQLLQLLAEHPRQVFTREQIIDQLWDGVAAPTNVSGLITRVRSKIEADPDHPAYIVTVWGVGYRFEGSLK